MWTLAADSSTRRACYLPKGGYDAVGVQEIAAAAGVAKPTLNHFFGSKHSLLETVFAARATQLNRALEDAAHYDGNLPFGANSHRLRGVCHS